MRNAEKYGGTVPPDLPVDFEAAMERSARIQSRLSRGISAARLREMGVDLYFAEGRFTDSGTISAGGKTLRFRKALVATGGRSSTPAIQGIAEAGYLTNESIFALRKCPGRILVIGGGPLGCELGQAYRRLGSTVVIAQGDPMFLSKEERDAAQILSDALARDGVEIHLNTMVVAVRVQGHEKTADLVTDGARFSVTVDEILVGIGRTPNVDGLDLEAAGVAHDSREGIVVDDFLQSSNPKIYAAGDVCMEHKFTHAAEASAHVAVRNALFPGRRRLSALTIPWCTYTDPETRPMVSRWSATRSTLRTRMPSCASTIAKARPRPADRRHSSRSCPRPSIITGPKP
jgi:pyruvate/2-oxoglutarate dehydrogenase complex dihydrolipoamide dehydrogenase (E3) component